MNVLTLLFPVRVIITTLKFGTNKSYLLWDRRLCD